MPAAHPSVRSCSVSTSPVASSVANGSRASPHSSSVKARSAARISVRSSVRRSRCRRRRGSARVEITRRSVGDRSSSVCSSRWTIGLSISWKSSSTSTTGSARSSRRSAICATCPSPVLRRRSAPAFARARSTPSQNRGLQLSSRSSVSQAIRGSAASAHDESRTVFPVPACAETSVTSPVVPRSISSCSLGRPTRRAGAAGGTSFAAGNGTAGRRRIVCSLRVFSTATVCIVNLGSWLAAAENCPAGFLRVFQQLPRSPRGHAGIPSACTHDGPTGGAPLRAFQLRLSGGASAR